MDGLVTLALYDVTYVPDGDDDRPVTRRLHFIGRLSDTVMMFAARVSVDQEQGTGPVDVEGDEVPIRADRITSLRRHADG